jgi:hypothetical protein
VERVADLPWTEWPESPGLRGRLHWNAQRVSEKSNSSSPCVPSSGAVGCGGWDHAGFLFSGEGMAMRKVALFMVALLFGVLGIFAHFSHGAENEPLAFKEYVLGKTTLGQFIQMKPNIRCHKGDHVLCDDSCLLRDETIAGMPTKGVNFLFYKKILEKIEIPLSHDSFDQVMSALKEKYGPPTKKESVVLKNRMGSTFERTSYVWRFANGTIDADEYAGDLDSSRIVYQTYHSSEEYKQRAQKRGKGASKDL